MNIVKSETDDRRSRLFIPAFVIGWVIIVAGAMTAVHDARDAHPFALAVHVVTFDLGHDALLVPTGLLIAWIIGKVVPEVARGPVRAGLAVSTMFVLFAWPLIHRWGRRPTNSSTLPLDYGRNLTIVLVTVWLVAGAAIFRRWKTGLDRRASPPDAPDVPDQTDDVPDLTDAAN